MPRRIGPFATFAFALQLGACGGGGGGGGGTSPPPPPPPANAAPAFGGLAFQGSEDTDLSGRIPASDPEGLAITITATSTPANGTLVSLATNGDFLYRPNSNYSGADSFNVRVVDPAGNAATGTVSLTVAAVNDAPQAAAISLQTDEDTAISGQVSATDIEPGVLVAMALGNPAHGSLQVNADGGFSYQPSLGYAGSDAFTVRVTDTGGAFVDVPVSVTVARVSVEYAGSTAAVAITSPQAAVHARSAWLGLKVLAGLSETALTAAQPGGARDFTVNGDLGGSVRYRGTLAANGVGRLTADYSQYRDSSLPGITLDGRELIDIVEPRTATTGQVRRLFKTLTYTASDLTGQLGGWLTRHDSRGAGPEGLTHQLFGSVVIREAPGGVFRWFTAIDLKREPATQPFRNPNLAEATVNAWSGVYRAYDSRTGYVDVSFSPSLNFLRQSSVGPLPTGTDLSSIFGRGSLLVSGSTARKVWLTGLSPDTFSLETNVGDGAFPDRSLAFRWEDDFAAPAGSDTDRAAHAVVTEPFDVKWANTSTAFWPEGRFSEQGQGQFLSHAWRIVHAPPGSTVTLVNANSTRPGFAPDRTGEYLLELRVSDGTQSSTDYLNVEVTAPAALPARFELLQADRRIAGSNPLLAINEEFVLDARRTYQTYWHAAPTTPARRWSVTRADSGGGTLIMTAPDGPVARFAPTQSGVYFASYSAPGGEADPFTYLPLYVQPGIRIKRVTALGMGSIALDYDNDGDLDVLGIGAQPGAGVNPYLRVLRRQADGRLQAPQYVSTFTTFENWDIGFNDLNADGRPDLIRSYFGGAEVALQQADGNLGAMQPLGNGANQCAGDTPHYKVVGAVDLDGNGRNDIIRTGLCVNGASTGQRFMIANLSLPGGFADASLITVPGASIITSGDSADLDGDGVREIVGAPAASASPDHFVVLRPNGAGGLAAATVPVSSTYFTYAQDVRIVDINGDGRPDIIGGVSPTFILTQDASHHFIERARITGSAAQQRNPYAFQTADFDGDGRLDLYLSASMFDLIPPTWWRQQPDGSFLGQLGMPVQPIAVFDANGDGLADFVSPYESLQPGYVPGAIMDIQVAPR